MTQTVVPQLTLGWRLRMALEHGSVSRQEIAAELGVDPATITRWTHDVGAPPKVAYKKQWALRCGVPYEWLVSGNTELGGDSELTVTSPRSGDIPTRRNLTGRRSSTAA